MDGITVLDLKAQTLQRLRQPAGNYDRFSLVSVMNALNIANLEVAIRLKCLHGFAIIILKDGYAQYSPPSDMIIPKCAFFYQSATSYYELDQKLRSWLDREKPGWRTVEGDPSYMFPGDNIGQRRKLGFYPRPNTNGTNYISTPDTGVVISATGLTTTGNITGLNSAAHATTCTDSAGRTLSSLGVKVGMTALNVTDGSKCQISVVSGSTFTGTLAGGSDNTWGLSDNWTILAGEYGVVTSVDDASEQYIFSSDLGEMVALSALTGNVYLEYNRQPLTLAYDTQYPETPIELHQYLPDYALWVLKRTSTKGSQDYNDAAAGLQEFNRALSEHVSHDDAMNNVSTIAQNW